MAVVAVWFGLEVAGVMQGAFSHFAVSSEVAPVDTGGAPGAPQVRRVRPTVTLARIQSDEGGLFAWHETVVTSGVAAARKNCTVTVFDASGHAMARYALDQAWPSKVNLGPLQVAGEDRWGETATLICENVRRLP
jgi:phage tail-like protein